MMGSILAMPATFTRHRYELPMMGAFFVIGAMEMFAVHLLVSLWSPAVAWMLTALTLMFLAHIALLVHGLMTWPTLIDDTGVTVRHGRRSEIFVPLSQVTGSEDVAFRPEEKGPHVFRASLMASPNVILRLAEPVSWRRKRLERISMRLDEPAAFQFELAARLRERAH
jgi:hypothetical protein